MQAYIYCRISSKTGKSEKHQISECEKYCENNNIKISKIVTDTTSSKNMKNKIKLGELIDEMKEGDILIVHSICRFSRNMLGGLKILDMLEKKKIKIYSVDDHVGYDDIYDRRKFRDIMNESELEIDRLSHRIKQGKFASKKTKHDLKLNPNNKMVNNVVDKFIKIKKTIKK